MIQKDFNGKERRAYIRFQKSLPVRFKIDGSQAGKIYLATTRNISRGGLCVEIAQETADLLEKISAPGHKIVIDLDTLISDQTTPFLQNLFGLTAGWIGPANPLGKSGHC
jgi:hypothetical protein